MSSAESAGSGSHPPRLVVTGVDGAIARAVLRIARDRYGVADVVPVLRSPGGAPAPTVPAGRTVVLVALSTDLAQDLRLHRDVRRAELIAMTRDAAAGALAGGARLVVVTSARVYGALADNVVPLPEDAPLRAVDDRGLVGDLLVVESEVARLSAEHPRLDVTLVRPAAVVGPGVDTTITRHFEPTRPLVLAGTTPLWQFAHVEDVASGVLAVLDHGLLGAVALASPGWLGRAEVERRLGKRHLELPRALAVRAAERLHALGTLSTSGADLAYVGEPWVVACASLTAAGWAPRYDNVDCVDELRRLGESRTRPLAMRRDAAFGTASAAVALAASAALVRRHRKRG
ncbi:NAD-dependent epimerase/dehydratase family protein [Agilicoccus flavus]|uniref:NAD-dependent epimerase/dehydratase family protein n=1 Tax=Agilicoccus flavus TaxID=2775968 RepID=UPI001CF6D0BA|nr:NAD-dependent epimerase/dehydratase family protein [Agilicoccus flavus]